MRDAASFDTEDIGGGSSGDDDGGDGNGSENNTRGVFFRFRPWLETLIGMTDEVDWFIVISGPVYSLLLRRGVFCREVAISSSCMVVSSIRGSAIAVKTGCEESLVKLENENWTDKFLE